MFLGGFFPRKLISLVIVCTLMIHTYILTKIALLQLIATAALFLAAKSEETARPLNDVLRASSELYHKQDISLLSYLLPVVSVFTALFIFVCK